MPDDGTRVGPTPLRVTVQRRVVVSYGPPVEAVALDFLSQDPDADLDVVGGLQDLFQRPAVLPDPVGVDLHDAHVEGAPGAHGPTGIAQGFFLGAGPHVAA